MSFFVGEKGCEKRCAVEGKDLQVCSADAVKLRQHPKDANPQTHGGGFAAGVSRLSPPWIPCVFFYK